MSILTPGEGEVSNQGTKLSKTDDFTKLPHTPAEAIREFLRKVGLLIGAGIVINSGAKDYFVSNESAASLPSITAPVQKPQEMINATFHSAETYSNPIETSLFDNSKACFEAAFRVQQIVQDGPQILKFTPSSVAHFDLTEGDLYGWVQSETPPQANFIYCPSQQACQGQMPYEAVSLMDLIFMKSAALSKQDGWESIVDGDMDLISSKNPLMVLCDRF